MMNVKLWTLVGFLAVLQVVTIPVAANQTNQTCDPAYAEVCIAPPPPDLDCSQIQERNFRVYLLTDTDRPSTLTQFDPHRFDGDRDGIGCEQRSRS